MLSVRVNNDEEMFLTLSLALTNQSNNYANACFLLPLPFTTRLESSRLGPEAAAATATGTRLCRGLCM